MTAANVIRLLLELDQFVISPRPSLYGEVAEAVRSLCDHAEGDLGDYQAIDTSAARNDTPWIPDTPILTDGALPRGLRGAHNELDS